jgi:aldehyde dehydrogenase (NAD+)
MEEIKNIESNVVEIERIYALQKTAANLQKLKDSSLKERLAKIKKIEKYLTNETHQEQWMNALWQDLHKCREEAITTELSPILSNMSLIYRELHHWLENKSVETPLAMSGLSSYIKYEPKGHVFIIGPWNYPLQLALNPLIYAIASGNVIIVKPSEIASATSGFIKKMISELFDEKEIAVIEGGIEETTALLEKPFNHIFFTGSPAVGKIVMRAASQHLTSVTLELGGKSPVINDESINPREAAEKVAWGKCINAGQTCIAPDYVLIHEKHLSAFVKAFQDTVNKFYNSEGAKAWTEYGRIINKRNFQRIRELIDDAIQQGADIALAGEMDEENKFISPFVFTGVNYGMRIMQEEIFGPVLPIITFKDIKEVPAMVNKLEKPLALYILSKNKKNIQFILNNTSAGGTVINELMVSSVNPYLPFGGINSSGIGKSNGKHSFIEFSNERGVVQRKWGNFKMIYPPFNKRIIGFLSKIAKL